MRIPTLRRSRSARQAAVVDRAVQNHRGGRHRKLIGERVLTACVKALERQRRGIDFPLKAQDAPGPNIALGGSSKLADARQQPT